MNESEKKVVYILTNPSMPGIVKIGKTKNLEQRIKDLYTTGVPAPFECYYAVEVDAGVADEIEKLAHQGLKKDRIHSGRSRREFFAKAPDEAMAILKIAETMGGKPIEISEPIVEKEEDKKALEKMKKIRAQFNFNMIDVKPGTKLHLKKYEKTTCEVHDDKKVKFDDKVMSLSRAAELALEQAGHEWAKKWGAVGTEWWCYNGRTLDEIRRDKD